MSGTVLFVDDQVEITDLIARMLKDENYTQYFANSGTEALTIMEKHPVDVIVTDMVMPLVSGLQLLSIIKEKYPDTVRIVLSGQLQIASVLAAINSGEVYRYITKPWKVDAASKLIIRQALEYADFLKKRRQCPEDCITLKRDALSALLSHLTKPAVLLHQDKVMEARLPEGAGVLPGMALDALRNLMDLTAYEAVTLAPDWIVYIRVSE